MAAFLFPRADEFWSTGGYSRCAVSSAQRGSCRQAAGVRPTSPGRKGRPPGGEKSRPAPYPIPGFGHINIRRSKTQAVLELILPGVSQNDVTLDVVKDGIVVTVGDAAAPRLRRRARLGEDMDRSAITASMADGILRVQLPYRPPPSPRRIPVSGAERAPESAPAAAPTADMDTDAPTTSAPPAAENWVDVQPDTGSPHASDGERGDRVQVSAHEGSGDEEDGSIEDCDVDE